MSGAELKRIYQSACDSKGFEGNAGQFKMWQQTLGWCEEADLSQALILYFSENTGFPMPAQLKTLAERARRERITKKSEPKELVRWKCPACGIYTCSWVQPGDYAWRRCKGLPKDDRRTDTNRDGVRVCGAVMNEVHRSPEEVRRSA